MFSNVFSWKEVFTVSFHFAKLSTHKKRMLWISLNIKTLKEKIIFKLLISTSKKKYFIIITCHLISLCTFSFQFKWQQNISKFFNLQKHWTFNINMNSKVSDTDMIFFTMKSVFSCLNWLNSSNTKLIYYLQSSELKYLCFMVFTVFFIYCL